MILFCVPSLILDCNYQSNYNTTPSIKLNIHEVPFLKKICDPLPSKLILFLYNLSFTPSNDLVALFLHLIALEHPFLSVLYFSPVLHCRNQTYTLRPHLSLRFIDSPPLLSSFSSNESRYKKVIKQPN